MLTHLCYSYFVSNRIWSSKRDCVVEINNLYVEFYTPGFLVAKSQSTILISSALLFCTCGDN